MIIFLEMMVLVPFHVGMNATYAAPFACRWRTTVGFRVPLANKMPYASTAQVHYMHWPCVFLISYFANRFALLPFKQRAKFAKQSRASTAAEGVRNAETGYIVTTVQG